MVSVPSKSSVGDATKSGASAGIPAGLGAMIGRSVLGPGLGTGVGGIVGASMLSGSDRDTMASTAVFHGLQEMGRSRSSGSSGGSNQGVM